jgi:phosphoglycolate phosphatase
MGAVSDAPTVVGFDLDLTLVDTRARIIASAVAGFADLGVEVDPAEVSTYLGYPLTHKAAHLAPHVDPQAFVVRYRHHYAAPGGAACPAMPGAYDALTAIRAGGGRVVVVSAKLDSFVLHALEGAGLLELVSGVHGQLFAQDKGPALHSEGASVYVGDHPGDIEAARTAGCLAVGVATGVHDRTALLAAGADVALSALTEFPAWYVTRSEQVRSASADR